MSAPFSLRLPDAARAAVDARRTTDAARGGDRRSVDARGDLTRGAVIARDLTRYYALLDRAARTLRAAWSEAEWALAMDACGGAYEPATIHLAGMAIRDSLEFGSAAARFGVDAARMTALGDALTPLDSAALVDAAERIRRDAGRSA